MKLPNVIIGGAPKSGTSSLYNWLVAHPDVCASSIKETFYLMDLDNPLVRLESNFHVQGLAGYQKYFAHCSPDSKVRIEATTHYLYQKTALEVLSQFQPLPQIIFLLRQPSLRIYSSYQFTTNNLANLDKSVSFTQLIDLIQNQPLEVLEKYSNPRTAANFKNSIKRSCYLDYLLGWRDKFGQENLHVFLFEELKKNPRKLVSKIAEILEINTEFYEQYDFKSRNETFTIKNQDLHRNARKIGKLVPKSLVKNIFKNTYLLMFSKEKSQVITPEDQKTLQELDDYFEPFNQKLAEEFNLDLSLWDRGEGFLLKEKN